MSNNYWDEEDEDDITTTPVAQGDDAMKNVRKALRAKEKENDALKERLALLEKAQSERTVKEILEQKGVTDPRAMKNLLRDIEGEVNEQSINDWLATDGDLYGYKPEAAAPAVTDADRQAIARQDALTQGALSPDRVQDINYRIDNADNMDELMAAWQSQLNQN